MSALEYQDLLTGTTLPVLGVGWSERVQPPEAGSLVSISGVELLECYVFPLDETALNLLQVRSGSQST